MADGDAQRLIALEKAVNDSAGRAGVLWTSFLTLGTYLLIATGSVTHRELFLNSAIKLPVLGVELPVTGYFLVAPMIYLIFHFYLLMQLEGLSEKVVDYNQVLNETFDARVDRRRARWRLDDFPFLQFLAGVRERRTGLAGRLQMLISWITVVLFPIVVLLQLQIVFLPYHSVPITWLHRACLIGDLGMIWFFWRSFRRNSESSRRRRIAVTILEAAGTLLVLIFSLSLATFPGETLYRNAVARAVDAAVALVFRDQAMTASKYFFEGDVDGVTGHPSSLFANRIILPDERFHNEAKKAEISVSLRGRDLRGAILPRADLSSADFTGATLVEASFLGARLERARFGCAGKLQLTLSEQLRKRAKAGSCDDEHGTDLRGADFSEALLHGAFFNHANMRGARFARAMMQGVVADDADLTGATFTYARMEGATFVNATLLGASLFAVQMQGADLGGADLSSATIGDAQLQGANLEGAQLDNAMLTGTNLFRAVIDVDDLEDTAIFLRVHGTPTYPRISPPSGPKGRDTPSARTMLDDADYNALVARALERVQNEDVKQALAVRLQPLDPARNTEGGQFPAERRVNSDANNIAKIRAQRVEAIGKLICEPDGAPYIARGLIYSGRIIGLEDKSKGFADDPALRIIAMLRGSGCPGAVGLELSDFRELTRVEHWIVNKKKRAKGEHVEDDEELVQADKKDGK